MHEPISEDACIKKNSTMKYGLLAVSTGCEGGVNIGDYIQALASAQFLPSVDLFLERETQLKEYDGEPVKMIMNGWYMNHPENWPPSDKIIPLWVALHINKCGLPDFLNNESIVYFKNHQPIGCRDLHSVELLQEKGVDAYFTGCMTLTLGYKYKSAKRSGKVYVVEPYTCTSGLVEHHKWKSIKTLVYLYFHYSDVRAISGKKGEKGFKADFYNAYFLMEYSKVFDYNLLVEAEYINQYNKEIEEQFITDEERLKYAEKLVKRYAEAECVITSRIHCGLPCLGIETPVIFVQKLGDGAISTDRFGGLINLFNTVTWDGLHLQSILSKEKINKKNFPKNKEDWRKISQKLIVACQNFIETTV